MIKTLGFLILSSAVLAQAPQQAPPGPIRFEDATAKVGHPVHPQLWRTATRVSAGKHRFGMRLVRLQQRRSARSLRRQRQAARRGNASLSAQAATRDSASQSSLPQQRRRHLHRRHRPGRRCCQYLTVSRPLPPTSTTTASSICFVTGYGRAILYRNNGDGTFEDVTAKAGIKVDGWSISSAWLDYDRDGCVDLFVGRYVKFDPKYRNLLSCRQLSRPARLRRRHQPSLPQQLQRHVHRCNGQVRNRRLQRPHHGRHRGRL